ncbi:diacylglycerol kinase family enzyme [Hoeflea marina]|uniref:Diacylglycerol kinase family enzyme n=1 Tax=Hoeflea marina TaxID=274592 RepID=A0A317PR35_9HYPH|nr:diacylglycerol kinase family protein [Hoeflea marina]PWW02020.1 diacylglycerol kinase family enzyme [Hoeflea marina]
MRLALLLNEGSGTFRTLDMDDFVRKAERVLVDHGHEVSVERVSGDALVPAIKRIASGEGLDALLVGGGDGTISAAAAQGFRIGIPIGVVPAGTMNLYARSLKLPMDPLEAIGVLAAGGIRNVDIATADDRPFVHQFSVGLHARLVRLRNARHFSSRRGKIAATLSALFDVIRNPPSFTVTTDAGDGPRTRKVSAVSVSNNRFNDQPVPYAELLDEGVLGLYHARAMTPGEMLSLTLDATMRRMQDNESIDVATAREVQLVFPRLRRDSRAVIDGELVKLAPEVALKCHPGALSLLAPQPA